MARTGDTAYSCRNAENVARPSVAYRNPQSSAPNGQCRQVSPQRHLGHARGEVDQGLDAHGEERQRDDRRTPARDQRLHPSEARAGHQLGDPGPPGAVLCGSAERVRPSGPQQRHGEEHGHRDRVRPAPPEVHAPRLVAEPWRRAEGGGGRSSLLRHAGPRRSNALQAPHCSAAWVTAQHGIPS